MEIYNGNLDKKVFPTSHTVAIVSAGRVPGREKDQMTIRKNGREDWSLFYCEAGRVYFENGVLEAGQVWLYPPRAPQKYTIYRQDRTVYCYLHFTGNDLAPLLRSLGIPVCEPVKVRGHALSDIFDRIQTSMQESSAISALSAESHALHLLTRIARDADHLPERRRMKRVTDEMEHAFAGAYDPAYYAGMMGLSVSRFDHLFKECTGISPYAYYVGVRMANACNLLEDTDLKIREIAEKCGYEDTLYFAQVFKKRTGIPPSQYRKEHKRIL